MPIPPLGKVDDIISVTNVNQTQNMNNINNTFIESKNLRFSTTKCHQIHIGKGLKACPKLKVHKDDMREVDSEKYLSDAIDKTGSIQDTINSRKTKDQGIISEILSILDKIPLGLHRIDVAMKLRKIMLLNGILYKSEAWHGVTKKNIGT